MKKIILFAILFISFTGIWAQSSPYLDTTFNISNIIRGRKYLDSLQGNLGAITVDGKGTIVTVTYSLKYIYIRRVYSDGSDDASFGNKGYKKIILPDTNTVLCSKIQPDGKILIGGQRSNVLKDMFILRLNYDGSIDNTFDNDGYWTFDFGGTDQVNQMLVQNDNKIIVAGKKTGGIAVARLNSDASFDLSFNSKGYATTGMSIQTVGGLEMDSKNGIYLAGDSASFYSVLKLLPDGTKDNSFGKSGIARTPQSYGAPVGLSLSSDGKIVVGGSYSQYVFTSMRWNPNGQADTKYGITANGIASYSCYYANMTGTFLDKEEEIVMTGSYSYYGCRLMRLNQNGSIDSTFGNNGTVNIANTPTSSLTILSPDSKYLVVALEGTNFYLYKVLNKPIVHILGSAYVSPKSIETFSAEIPGSSKSGATYIWSYSGIGVTLYPDVAKPYQFSILFSPAATEGILTCKVNDGSGAYLGRGELKIKINTKPSNSNQLANTACISSLNDCSLGYIDNFTLNTLSNPNSGCSANGYSDYTQSNFTDTLAAGGVYSAKLKIPNSGTFTNYVGIWIDYNNDGTFSNIDEYVGEGYSNDSKVMVDVFLKNREGYDGPKRLRVRSRPDVKITSSDACPASGETGETEDYLILLEKQPSLEAPQIITPNEDGQNDYFVIHGVDPNKKNKLTIFDRIGAVKFSSSNYENDWSGTDKNGSKLSPGTYYYVFTNDKNSIKGFVEIRY